jgi:hypothetical protein
MIDVTMPLQVLFNNKERNIATAKVRYRGTDKDAWMLMVIGLRSDILSAFERFEKNIPGRYQPCDIPSLVPALALMVSSYSRGLAVGTMSKDDYTKLVLIFEGQANRKGGSIRALATSIYNFMARWQEWAEVLLSILRRDPIVGEWEIDFREFLAAESGYRPMAWYAGPSSYMDRAIGLERIAIASNALLSSVLSRKQLQDPLIQGLREWLGAIEPLPEIIPSIQISEEAEI